MRKKVTFATMADRKDSESLNLSHPQTNVQSQGNGLVQSVKRLALAARRTAQALHAIKYLQRSLSIVTELVLEVCALSGMLSSLEEDLLLQYALKATCKKHMWTKEHHENLMQSIQECEDVLRATCRAIRTADERFRVAASSKRADNYIDHFQLDGGSRALDAVPRCFHLVSKTKVMVRYTALSRIENLSDEEIQDLLRLTLALQHSDLDAVWARKDELFASKQMQQVNINVNDTKFVSKPEHQFSPVTRMRIGGGPIEDETRKDVVWRA
ncbi:hypothetical protein N0V86_003696 [Didymella sp. IMI 355093]|nr:hypothetical protein N0V86_003696 [Didymella sp. IMI 355093]